MYISLFPPPLVVYKLVTQKYTNTKQRYSKKDQTLFTTATTKIKTHTHTLNMDKCVAKL